MAAPHEAPGGGSMTTRKAPWRNAEDAALLEQVRQQGGPRNWEGISAALPGRNARSCRLRWWHHLGAPGAASGSGSAPPFTADEDAVIVACYRVFPNKWATIARFLAGRTDTDVKERYLTALRDLLAAPEPLRRRQDGTLPLFPLVPGDVRTSGGGGVVIRRHQPVIGVVDEDDQSGACLGLFPLASGDLGEGRRRDSAPEAAGAMDVDGGMLEMRLGPASASTAMAAFRAMVQAVRAP